MSSAFILQHSEAFGPGRLVPVLRDFGIPIQHRKLYAGDEVPTDLDDMRLAIFLGGPMRLTDGTADKHPFIAREMELLKRLIATDRPTLGIGLGAQMLAQAAGAKVHPNVKPSAKPEDPQVELPEFGWLNVTFPFPGGTEPIVFGLVDGSMMFHWHRDTFELPRLPGPATPPPPGTPPPPTGNALLSSSRACKNQAFRFKNRLFGFQYHFELTQQDIDAILSTSSEDIRRTVTEAGVATIRSQTPANFARYARQGDRIIKNFVQFTKTY